MKHSLYAYLTRRSSEELENLKAFYEGLQESDVDKAILQMLIEILQKRKRKSENA